MAVRARREPAPSDLGSSQPHYQDRMRRALLSVNIDSPFGRPLVPIRQLSEWHGRTSQSFGLAPLPRKEGDRG